MALNRKRDGGSLREVKIMEISRDNRESLFHAWALIKRKVILLLFPVCGYAEKIIHYLQSYKIVQRKT